MPEIQQPTRSEVQRVIRVFVSSTFRDMQVEREVLVKRVFPQLRKMCEERGVTWGEVDLRWGITEEQKAEGKVLPICLAEIQRSRPYFIGLLGERYGWIPAVFPEDLLAQEPWLKEQAGHSVTEMEILHGVLNDPLMENHAYFYFRDPGYVDRLPAGGRREDFVSEGPEQQKKLADLKKRVRSGNFPLREDYPDPQALGELVLGDFSALIERLFPPRPADDFLTSESRAHEAFIMDRSRVYTGRKGYLDRLDAQAAGEGKPLVITGESGNGKSALLANWIGNYRLRHPDHHVLAHFVGASSSSTDWKLMLNRLIGEIQARLGLSDPVPGEGRELQLVFARLLLRAAQKGPLILVIDALDQLDDRDEAPDLTWLLKQLPPAIRLIASTLPGRPLDEWRRRGWPEMEIAPLDLGERRNLVVEYLSQYAKTLDPERSEKLISVPLAGNPLYLRTLLEELRLFGVHERLDEQLDHYLEASDIPALFERILERYEQDFDGERPNLVRDAMSWLWVSRNGLSEAELLDLLGRDGSPLPRSLWSPLFLAAEKSLINRSGLLSFSHAHFRQAVEKRYLADPARQKLIHQSLANYFNNYALSRSPRMVAEFPWQCFQAGSWEWLARFLADEDLLMRAWKANDYDVSAYWAALECHGQQMTDVYRSVIESPLLRTEPQVLWIVASLLSAIAGKLELAVDLFVKMAELAKQQGDLDNLSDALGAAGNDLLKFGEHEKALSLFKEKEKVDRERGDLGALSLSLLYQGRLCIDIGDLDKAMALAKEQEAVCRKLGSDAFLAHALPTQAVVLVEHGEYEQALKLYEESGRLYRETGQQEFYCENLLNLGNLLLTMNENDRALELFREAESLSNQFGGEEQKGKAWNLQAWALIKKKDLEKAERLLDRCEEFWRKREEKRRLAAVFDYRSMIRFMKKDMDGALRCLKECIDLYTQGGNIRAATSARTKLAKIYDSKGQFRDALQARLEIVDVQKKRGNKSELCENLGRLGMLCSHFGMLPEAEKYSREHIELCHELHQEENIEVSLFNLGIIHHQREEYPQALKFYADVEAVYRRQNNRIRLADVLGNKADILAKLDQREEAILAQKEKEKICREEKLMEGLAGALINQAMLLGAGKRFAEAKPLAEEAYLLACRHGSADFAKEVKEMRDIICSVP